MATATATAAAAGGIVQPAKPAGKAGIIPEGEAAMRSISKVAAVLSLAALAGLG